MSPSCTKLSVIVPVYNVKEYLRRCLDSILAQDYENLEVICVDDGSTDGSGGILDEYALKDPRIKVVHKENGGVVSARKAAMRKATGHYATFVDPDDWIDRGMYKSMMGIIQLHQVDLVTSGWIRDYGTHVVQDPEKTSGLYTGTRLQDEIKDKLVDFDRPFRMLVSPSYCNKIFKTEMLRDLLLKMPNEAMVDTDTLCVYPYLMRCASIYVKEECFYHYCQRQNSSVNNAETPEERFYETVTKSYAYARDLLPPNILNYLEKYTLLMVCPRYSMRYGMNELYPFGRVEENSKVVIYGCGSFGRRAKRFIEENTSLQVVGWVDKGGDGKTILRQEQLASIKYDYILVCVLVADVVANICNDLEKMGIDMRKVKCVCNI